MLPIDELLYNLINVGDWYQAPPIALDIIKHLDEEYGGNVAIGEHSEIGYYVLHDQGTGPGLVWQEFVEE